MKGMKIEWENRTGKRCASEQGVTMKRLTVIDGRKESRNSLLESKLNVATGNPW